MFNLSIYWFKRDLRLHDNLALYDAVKNSKEIIPIFIFIPDLIRDYKVSGGRLGFLIDCIENLTTKLKEKGSNLYCFINSPINIFSYLIEKYKPSAVFTNKAYSYLGEEFENNVKHLCVSKGIQYIVYAENFLSDIEKIPYRKVFTPFFKQWIKHLKLDTTKVPEKISTPLLKENDIYKVLKELKYTKQNHWKVEDAATKLKNFDFNAYGKNRDLLYMEGTSKLSPYIRFGILSLREIFNSATESAGLDNQYIKELAWREFWYHIKINFPDMKYLEFQEKRRGIRWERDEKLFKSIRSAETGYPIIDAAIRQLIREGWMHNRARMIVASFFTKDLLLDWRLGEEFFKEHLIDYDEVVNIGNWQWNASVGPDPKPLRIFNPIVQAQKFDPEAMFIKKYIPELAHIPAHMLHNPLKYELPYPKPIVNHYQRIPLIKRIYLYTQKPREIS